MTTWSCRISRSKIRDVIENVVVHQSLWINETFNRRSYDVESVYQYSLLNSTHTS